MKNNIIQNPWDELSKEMQKRISKVNNHNIYWAKDSDSNYVLLFKLKNKLNNNPLIKMKEIKIKYEEKVFAIFLLEKNKWEIFKILTRDLLEIAIKNNDEKLMIEKIIIRIKEWGNFFQKENRGILSLEEQMGIFSELHFFKNIVIPKLGIEECLESWRGPTKDNQDFLFKNTVIEIKSCITSKGKVAIISNENQLASTKQNFYLVHYSLTPQNKVFNENIISLIKKIENQINNEDKIEIFYKKLIEYGFILNIKEEDLYSFIVDDITYFKVDEKFPKICSQNIDLRIKNLKYTIDLEKCKEFLSTEKEVKENI